MLGTIRHEHQSVDAQLPILSAKTRTIQRDASFDVWAVRAAAALFVVFGVLARVLAAIGAFGLNAYDVSRRTREIGIGMALGAIAGTIEAMLVREGGRATVAALAVGMLRAAAIGKLAAASCSG